MSNIRCLVCNYLRWLICRFGFGFWVYVVGLCVDFEYGFLLG